MKAAAPQPALVPCGCECRAMPGESLGWADASVGIPKQVNDFHFKGESDFLQGPQGGALLPAQNRGEVSPGDAGEVRQHVDAAALLLRQAEDLFGNDRMDVAFHFRWTFYPSVDSLVLSMESMCSEKLPGNEDT